MLTSRHKMLVPSILAGVPDMDLSTVPNGWIIALWFGVVGMCVGSFANVVVYRLPIIRKLGDQADGQKLQELITKHGKFNLSLPRSSCPCCGTKIKALHNIPVLSWILLRGKCASCAKPIPIKYPAVELLFGIAFAAYVWSDGLSVAGLLTLPVMAIGFCLFTIFLQTRRIVKSLAFAYVGAVVLQLIIINFVPGIYVS